MRELDANVSAPPPGYDEPRKNLAYRFNRQVMKILSAIDGGDVAEYEKFAHDRQPFVEGMSGYFKLNLYPIGFKNTSHARWLDGFRSFTGFEKKADYLRWCREKRFPRVREWARTHRPRLILCQGKTYRKDFLKAFSDTDTLCYEEVIHDRSLYWTRNADNTLVVVVPFMTGPKGLQRNTTIQAFGERIRELM